MDKKQVEEDELKLTEAIQKQETEAANLKREQNKVEEIFDNIQFELKRRYQELARLNQEEIHFGNKSTHMIQQTEDEQFLYFRQKLGRFQDDINQQYNKQAKVIEQETELLQKKKRELDWG